MENQIARRRLLIALGALPLVSACGGSSFDPPLGKASSLSQYGITWTFNGEYVVGQYCNGDYFVVAPAGLTITAISPASTLVSGRTRHGSMVNPNAAQYPNNGFDSTLDNYLAAVNAARPGGANLSASNPLVLPPGSSLISSITVEGAGERPQLSDAAVLTVVASAPAQGSFRPPYTGSDKTHYWNKGALKYSILQSLAPVNRSPTSLADNAAAFQRPWIEICTAHPGRKWHADNNQPIYGRDMAAAVAGAVLALHHNFTNAQKEQAFINLVQYGIDVYSAAKTGGDWHANGGHNCGRKLALLFAGLALGDANMLWYANAANFLMPKGFQEDQQVFVVAQSDVGKAVEDQWISHDRLRLTYTAGMVGLPEWGIEHVEKNGYADAANWSAIYRTDNAYPYYATALAAGLTPGGYAAWNNPLFFAYADRVRHVVAPESRSMSSNMWDAYRSRSEAPAWVPVAPVPTPALITLAGDRLLMGFSTSITLGANGSNGISIQASGGAVTLVGTPTDGLSAEFPAATEKAWSLSRVIAVGETLSIAYVQPGDGLKDLVGGLPVGSFNGLPVVNYSTRPIGAT